MSPFPDTSFLCSLYRQQVHSPKAIAVMTRRKAALPVSSLLLLEFRQSVRLQGRLHARDRANGFGPPQGLLMLEALASDLEAGVLVVVPVDWSQVHQIGEGLSARYTNANGHRLVDLLHVATALHLGASEFLTFDANQALLARAEGLKSGLAG